MYVFKGFGYPLNFFLLLNLEACNFAGVFKIEIPYYFVIVKFSNFEFRPRNRPNAKIHRPTGAQFNSVTGNRNFRLYSRV